MTARKEEPLPERWRPWQRRKNTLIYRAVTGLVWLLGLCPYRLVWLVGQVFGRLAPLVARRDYQRSIEQIQAAFPTLSPAACATIARRMFVHLGISAAEVTKIERFVEGAEAIKLSDAQHALLKDALAEEKGVVVITGHIGNWEILAQSVARAGYPITSIAKPLYDPRLTTLVDRFRTRYGMELIWRGDSTAGKDMLRVFRNKRILGLLIDQDTKVQGTFVPFFGRPAFTPSAAAALALRFSAPILMAWAHRTPQGHVCHFERLDYDASDTSERHAEELTARATARLQAAIEQHPEQWVWLHKRWKTQPPMN